MSYWQAMIEGRVRYAEVGRVSTRILEAGDSKSSHVVLLLHGSGGHAENFVTNVVPLSKAGYVVAPDLLGHGLNDRPSDSTYSFRAMIEHVKMLIEQLESPEVTVVGLSLGGLVAAHVADELPNRIARLVFVCSGGLTPNGPADNTLPRLSDGVTALFNDPTANAVRTRFERMIHGPENLSDEMVSVREFMLRLPGARDTVIPVLRDYDDHRDVYDANSSLLKGIKADTLFCWGDHNHPGPEIAEQAASMMSRGKVEVFAKSGHWPHVEEEDKFHRVLLEFMRT